jgi:hypothetical protein
MRTTDVALVVALATAVSIFGANAAKPSEPESLYDIVAALDTAVFDTFNRCSEPGQLEKHASFFAPDVEFYHDNGGVTWTREDMIAGTRKHVCGNFHRELIANSLKVYPIKGFGAIAQGSHRFCQFSSGTCDGMADFTMIWREQHGKWEITRALSYGHRPASEP